MTCPICGRGHKNSGSYCRACQIGLDKERAKAKEDPIKRAIKFVAYQGHVIGFFKRKGKLIAQYIGMSLSGIPKGKLINLDEYCPGFDREQIKKLKATVLKLSC